MLNIFGIYEQSGWQVSEGLYNKNKSLIKVQMRIVGSEHAKRQSLVQVFTASDY